MEPFTFIVQYEKQDVAELTWTGAKPPKMPKRWSRFPHPWRSIGITLGFAAAVALLVLGVVPEGPARVVLRVAVCVLGALTLAQAVYYYVGFKAQIEITKTQVGIPDRMITVNGDGVDVQSTDRLGMGFWGWEKCAQVIVTPELCLLVMKDKYRVIWPRRCLNEEQTAWVFGLLEERGVPVYRYLEERQA